MPKRITDDQRERVLNMLAEGHDRQTIAAAVGLTSNQVAAVAAHVTMGTYAIPGIRTENKTGRDKRFPLAESSQTRPNTTKGKSGTDILLGSDLDTGEEVYWNPDPNTGSANPHMLVLGESGFGKTYTIACLLAELAQNGIHSIVLDYAQGFSRQTLPREFIDAVAPIEIDAGLRGININPLQILPADVHGPVNVAQRVADTFARVYNKIGVQQHAVLRQAIIDVFALKGIITADPMSWRRDPPEFAKLKEHLDTCAENRFGPASRAATLVSSHISTMFVFNTFRPGGQKLAWTEILKSKGKVLVIRLKGLEHSLERAVTEFLLWNLIGYIESVGPAPLRCFIVLDEAHRLSLELNSPAEKLLREGRKFGLGLLLASQQPEDFSPIAFANTATKLVFQIGDERSVVSRQLFRKVRNAQSFADIYELITRLPRGVAYVVTNNFGKLVTITSIDKRIGKMQHLS
jgi:DNA phosphorothioation-dependent restriction protein DptH